MTILLDTHVWLWWISEPSRLGDNARAIITDGRNQILFSVASCWEIAIKHGLGRLELPDFIEEFVPQRLARDNIRFLPIAPAQALRVASLPPYHRDPFDRLLVAQAQCEQWPLLTADPQIVAYEVQTLPANR